jgi:pyrroline-5-carboxylate reductase
MAKSITDKIGFIGGGNMAFAIGSGLVRKGSLAVQK